MCHGKSKLVLSSKINIDHSPTPNTKNCYFKRMSVHKQRWQLNAVETLVLLEYIGIIHIEKKKENMVDQAVRPIRYNC
jgi:hypothetical protein